MVARAGGRWLVVAAVAILVGCGPKTADVPRGAEAAPPGQGSRTPTQALVAVLDQPLGVVPNAVRFVDLGGRTVGSSPLAADTEALASAGDRLLVAGGGRLAAIRATGSVDDLGRLVDDLPGWLVRGLVASPNGQYWAWSVVTQDPDGVVHVRLDLGSATGIRTILARDELRRALQPIAWTTGGLVVADEPVGIGGYVLFRRAFGPTAILDPTTGSLRPLTDDACAFSDLAPDGRVACIVDGREGPHDAGPVRLRVLRPGAPPLDVPLAPSVAQAGAALFSPDGTTLTLATSPALANGAERIDMALVDATTGALRPLPTSGLTPVVWLDDRHLVATRPPGSAGGTPGTYVVALDGSLIRLSSSPTFVGLVHTR